MKNYRCKKILQQEISHHNDVLRIIEKAMRLGIGDQGRLNYLKNAFKKNSIIYESDKKFLEQIRNRLEENSQAKIIKAQKQKRYVPKNYPTQNTTKLFQKNQETHTTEKVLVAMMQEMHELKQRQLRTMDQIQILNSKLEIPKGVKNPEETTVPTEKLESNPPSLINKKTQSFVKESSKVMIWSASGLAVLWYAGFLNLINLGSTKDVLLGISIGLASGIIVLQKIQKLVKK